MLKIKTIILFLFISILSINNNIFAEDNTAELSDYMDPAQDADLFDMQSDDAAAATGTTTTTTSTTTATTVNTNVAYVPEVDAKTEEIFKTMSDLERQSILLKLQTEKLKLEKEQEKLQIDLKKIKREQEELDNPEIVSKSAESTSSSYTSSSNSSSSSVSSQSSSSSSDTSGKAKISDKYSIKSVMGTGGNLIIILKDNDKQKDIKVKEGSTLSNGYKVSRISVDEGIVFEKDGDTQTLSFSN